MLHFKDKKNVPNPFKQKTTEQQQTNGLPRNKQQTSIILFFSKRYQKIGAMS